LLSNVFGYTVGKYAGLVHSSAYNGRAWYYLTHDITVGRVVMVEPTPFFNQFSLEKAYLGVNSSIVYNAHS
jgi:hypothetical protein